MSRDPTKPSYQIPEYLKDNGYRIIPINPFVESILGEKSYKTLLDIPSEVQKTIEVVEIFRPNEDIPPIVEQIVEIRRQLGVPYVVWMQLGIINEKAAQRARESGLVVVMDHCMMVEHKRVFGE